MGLKDDLIAAKALISTPDKWCKGIDSGKNCVMWAVGRATGTMTGNNNRWHEAEHALRKALPGHYGGHPVVTFNDLPETTHADIMALFDRAIAAQEKPNA